MTILGALDVVDRQQIENLLGVKKSTELTSDPTRVTKLGSLLSKVPLSPKFAKMLVVALKYDLAHFAIMMLACMSVAEIYQDCDTRTGSNGSGADIHGAALNDDIDPDLITSIDRDRNAKKRKRLENQTYHDNMQA